MLIGSLRTAAQMDLWILLVLVIAGVAGSLEVHFENKDGGFFLKHDRSEPGDRSRLHHSLFSHGPRRKEVGEALDDGRGGGEENLPSSEEEEDGGDGEGGGGPKSSDEDDGGEAAVLSVDRFAVFQTSRPISVRATYGPFSTKQTVPARYIVPDPVDAPLPPINPAVSVPVPGFPNATSLVATAPAQPHLPNLQLFLGQQPQSVPPSPLDLDPSSHNLDISAHLVTPEVPRDAPVLRILFHTGQQSAASSSPGLSPPPSLLPQGDKAPRRSGARRQYQQHAAASGTARIPSAAASSHHAAPSPKQPRVCIVLYASLEEGRGGPDRTPTPGPLSAACSPDAEEADGACVAQVTIPASWWPPLPPPMPPSPQAVRGEEEDLLPDGNPPPRLPPAPSPPKMPRVKVHAAFSVFEPRGGEGCVPTPGSRVQIQPVTPVGPPATLVAARAPYRELRADERLSMLLPHAPLYPLSRVHVPVFITARPGESVSAFVIRARVKSGVRILGAEPSNTRRWTVSVELSPKQTVATVTAFRRDATDTQDAGDAGVNTEEGKFTPSRRGQHHSHGNHGHHSLGKKKWGTVLTPRYPGGNLLRVDEVFSWLLEVEEGAALWEGGRIVWGVRFVRDAVSAPHSSYPSNPDHLTQRSHRPLIILHRNDPYHGEGGGTGGVSSSVGGEERRKLATRLEIQKDDVQAVLPISKNWEVMNTAILTGKQVSQAMKVFIVSQAGKVADVTLQSSCHSEEESVLKVSSSCSSVYVDGTEVRGSTNASVVVAYGSHVGVARFTVWVPELPLEVAVADPRLSQVKGWRVVEDAKALTPAATPRLMASSSGSDTKRLLEDGEHRRAGEATLTGAYRNWGAVGVKKNGLEQQEQPIPERHICRLRFQQSPVEVYSRFFAEDHDSGRVSYFISRRTWLRVTDLVLALLRVSDTRIASLDGRILQGQSTGRTEVQVLSPISGRVVGAKEVRVGNDKVTILKLGVRVVSGLQLSITPDGSIENGYIAETSITRKLTAQYQEGLLDIDVEFSDGTKTPLRQVSVTDYQLAVDSLDTDVVAFAPMLASPHPRVIAVGEGRGDLLRVSLLLPERCPRARPISNQSSGLSSTNLRRKSSSSMQQPFSQSQPLASAYARVEVHFARPDSALRPDFVQNDGGGEGGGLGALSGHGGGKGSFKGRDGRMPSDLQDILIGIPLKDENDHEPTVQARQHVSNSAASAGASSSSTAGARSGHRMHMTPLEIGMYVLLGAFCFAIVVFVVSCVVYASRFKEIPGGGNSGLGLGSGLGVGPLGGSGNINVGKLGRGGAAKRESTTNAHDWVWLGRATLERASGMGVGRSFGQSEGNEIDAIRITTNPNYRDETGISGDSGVGMVTTTVFDASNDQPTRPSIDTSTYCKGNPGRSADNVNLQQHHHGNHQNNAGGFVEIDKAWMNRGGGGRGGDGMPPTPPPHGLPEAPLGFVAESNYDGAIEYRPPVPPHRNIGAMARIGPVRTQAPTPGFHEVSVHSALGKESSDVSSPSPPPPPPPKERRSCRKEHNNLDGGGAPWPGGVRVLPSVQRSDSGSPAGSRGAAARHHHHHHHHHKHHKNHSDGGSSTDATPKSILNVQRFQPKVTHMIGREGSQREEGALAARREKTKEENLSAARMAREDSESTADEEAAVGRAKQPDHGDSFRRDLGVVGEDSDELPEPMFVIYADSEASGYSSTGAVQEVGRKNIDSQEDVSDLSQTNVVGNPMFSDPKEFERKRQLLLQSRKFGGQTDVGKVKERRDEGKDGMNASGRCPSQVSPYKKDVDLDLDLEMDYRKIMEYFDSLKESNA